MGGQKPWLSCPRGPAWAALLRARLPGSSTEQEQTEGPSGTTSWTLALRSEGHPAGLCAWEEARCPPPKKAIQRITEHLKIRGGKRNSVPAPY